MQINTNQYIIYLLIYLYIHYKKTIHYWPTNSTRHISCCKNINNCDETESRLHKVLFFTMSLLSRCKCPQNFRQKESGTISRKTFESKAKTTPFMGLKEFEKKKWSLSFLPSPKSLTLNSHPGSPPCPLPWRDLSLCH